MTAPFERSGQGNAKQTAIVDNTLLAKRVYASPAILSTPDTTLDATSAANCNSRACASKDSIASGQPRVQGAAGTHLIHDEAENGDGLREILQPAPIKRQVRMSQRLLWAAEHAYREMDVSSRMVTFLRCCARGSNSKWITRRDGRREQKPAMTHHSLLWRRRELRVGDLVPARVDSDEARRVARSQSRNDTERTQARHLSPSRSSRWPVMAWLLHEATYITIAMIWMLSTTTSNMAYKQRHNDTPPKLRSIMIIEAGQQRGHYNHDEGVEGRLGDHHSHKHRHLERSNNRSDDERPA